ncbi:MAG: tRNA-intron lyase [Thermoplasmatota archaeon]
MEPYLQDDGVIVADVKASSTLMNKGSYGESLPGGFLKLSLIEAAYLLENGRITVKSGRKGRRIDLRTLIARGLDLNDHFFENHLVHRDLRNRGLIAKESGEGNFLVYPRGGRPGRAKADAWVSVFRENDGDEVRSLYSSAVSRENVHRNYLAAVVDADWDITYYLVRTYLRGKEADGSKRADDIPGIEKGEIITDLPRGGILYWGERREELHGAHFMGSEFVDSLMMSREEDRLINRRSGMDSGGDIKWETYYDLRKRGWFVRTGFKYGTHYRVYTQHPSKGHSDLLVHCLSGEDRPTWEELSRGIRLCHSVNKRMIFAFSPADDSDGGDAGSPRYLSIEWIRP